LNARLPEDGRGASRRGGAAALAQSSSGKGRGSGRGWCGERWSSAVLFIDARGGKRPKASWR
jgi:hypothetical protein